MKFIVNLLGTMAGLWVAARFIPGITIAQGTTLTESLIILALLALVLTVANSIVKPFIKLFAFPLYLLTFGLFALVTNALVFMIAGWASTNLGLPFMIDGLWTAILGSLVTAVISSVVASVLSSAEDSRG